ncbi:MAG: hypothetical protein WC624_04235 [Candidatus Margulisiibacteriota bacterium]
MDLIIAFFIYLPLHFWDSLIPLFSNPSDLGLLAATAFYGISTLIEYSLLFLGIDRVFDAFF